MNLYHSPAAEALTNVVARVRRTTDQPTGGLYRVVWTRRASIGGATMTVASDAVSKARALQEFNSVRAVRLAAGGGRGSLRVLAEADYRRLVGGER